MTNSKPPVGITDRIPEGARVCAAHQPNLLPWAGYFAKMHRADHFVVADTVQYVKQNFINRCRIPDKNGPRWLSIPVLRHGRLGQTEREVRMDDTQPWRKTFAKTLMHRYGKSPLFESVGTRIVEEILKPREYLLDLNLACMHILIETLGIRTPITLLSAIGVTTPDRCERIIGAVKATGCTHYLSGKGGSTTYLESETFEHAGISLSYFSYREPPYPQPGAEFIGGCSIIDSLFREGLEVTKHRIGIE